MSSHALESSTRVGVLVCVAGLFALVPLNAHPPQAQAADIDIWLDAGHGGRDSGATGFDKVSVYPEKSATVEVSTKVFNLLGSAGFFTFMTRYGDSYPTLSQRVGMANGLEANEAAEIGTCQAFVSIHMNSNVSAAALGTEVYYGRYRSGPKLANAYRADSGLAASVYNRLIQNTPAAFMGCNSNRGVKTAGFYVVKWPYVPAILAEVCFISNQCQQQKIKQGGNQGLVASGIVTGIADAITPGSLARVPVPRTSVPSGLQREPWQSLGLSPNPNAVSAALSVSESFDGATFPPAGWSVTSAGQPAPNFWARQTDGAYVHTGAGAGVVGGVSTGAVDEWLISPMVLLSPTDHGLQFYWMGNRTWAAQANATCLVRPKGAGAWTTLWSLLNEGSGQEFRYRQRVVDITTWLGDSVQVAFRVAGSNGADFAVDDVLTGNFAPFPIAPANDACATAQALPSGHFELVGSTCSANNSLNPYHANSLSCASDDLSGGDVFYHLTVASGDTLDVNLAGDWQAGLYIVSACDTAVASCLAASRVLELTDTTSVATLHHQFASGGGYYLGVDGIGGECGDFRITGFLRGTTTSVGDQVDAVTTPHLRVSPNPANGLVAFSGLIHDQESIEGIITVFDAAGRRVWRGTAHATGGRFVGSWDGRRDDGRRASPGTYLVQAVFRGAVGVSTRMVLLD